MLQKLDNVKNSIGPAEGDTVLSEAPSVALWKPRADSCTHQSRRGSGSCEASPKIGLL